MKAFLRFFKGETVFCVSLFLAVLSSFAVRPDAAYLAYPDYRTLALLFSLMIIGAGFRSLGVFDFLGQSLLKRAGSLRRLSVTMVLLCFGCSMVITNDVTLITFVPFTILVFRMIGEEERVLKVVVLETIAANLGSMATPIGNPQNLYLYTKFNIPNLEFMGIMAPPFLLSILLITLCCIIFVKPEPLELQKEEVKLDPKRTVLYLILFALSIIIVFRVIPYWIGLIIIPVVLLIVDRKALLMVDYSLLLTFVFFFIFAGNMARIDAVRNVFSGLLEKNTLLVSVLSCQIISNVPSAILLSQFTGNYRDLLVGVNIGGVGTLISSLASLITFREYVKLNPGKGKFYVLVFSLFNFAFLFILTGFISLLNYFV